MGREVHCLDSVPWLEGLSNLGAVVTSLPDPHEMAWDIPTWARWFPRAAIAAMRAAEPSAPAIFYQTDRKADGRTYSKAGILLRAAHEAGLALLWHKIVLRRDVGKTDLHRPGYTHLMAFSRAGKPGPAMPDVIERGYMTYPDAMGLGAAVAAVVFAARSSHTIVDPFCGRGTVLAVAEQYGLHAIGADVDPSQCDLARVLTLPGEHARAS